MTLSREDDDHLRLLSVFHYVVAGLMALFSLFPVIHLAVGTAVVLAPESMSSGKGGPPPALFGWFFIILAGAMILAGLSLSACIAFAGRFLARRERYLFCLVTACVAAVTCMPFGTVLGVFTIIVLMRPTVKEAFGYPPT